MRVFVAGGSGVVGSRLIPALVEAGHEVSAGTRSEERAGSIRALGAEPVVADALDREAIVAAVSGARPEAVIHQLTAIPSPAEERRTRTREAISQVRAAQGQEAMLRAVEIEPWSRRPERRWALTPYEP